MIYRTYLETYDFPDYQQTISCGSTQFTCRFTWSVITDQWREELMDAIEIKRQSTRVYEGITPIIPPNYIAFLQELHDTFEITQAILDYVIFPRTSAQYEEDWQEIYDKIRIIPRYPIMIDYKTTIATFIADWTAMFQAHVHHDQEETIRIALETLIFSPWLEYIRYDVSAFLTDHNAYVHWLDIQTYWTVTVSQESDTRSGKVIPGPWLWNNYGGWRVRFECLKPIVGRNDMQFVTMDFEVDE